MEQRLLFRILFNKYDQSPSEPTDGRTGVCGAFANIQHWPTLDEHPHRPEAPHEISDAQQRTRDDLKENLGDPMNN